MVMVYLNCLHIPSVIGVICHEKYLYLHVYYISMRTTEMKDKGKNKDRWNIQIIIKNNAYKIECKKITYIIKNVCIFTPWLFSVTFILTSVKDNYFKY